MNELQIGMIGLGVVAVGGVLAYNKWQERRQREIAERVLNPVQADILLDGAAAATAAERKAPEAREVREDHDADERDPAAPARDTFSANAAIDPHLARGNENVATSGSVGAPAVPPTAVNLPAYAAGGRIEPHLRTDDVDVDDDVDETIAAAPVQENPPPTRPVPPSLAGAVAAPVAAPSPVQSRLPPAAPSESAAPPTRPAPPRAREPLREGAALVRDAAPSALMLSSLIDYVAIIEAADPASASDLLRSSAQALARVRKPVRWFGRDERSGEWELLQEGARAPAGEYRRVHVGLQLVDRRGPASDAELAVFQRSMQDLADGLVAVVELAPAQPALVAAASLDAFCADVDIQIGLNVVSQGTAFPGSKLRALAEAAGMVLDGEGRFVRRDDEGEALFILCNQESDSFAAEAMKSMTTHGVTFLLDVPRVAHGDRVFAQMLEQAKRFAATLQGVLVDDNRRPLAEGTLDPIRRTIAQSQAAMAARHIPAGGALALRLFS